MNQQRVATTCPSCSPTDPTPHEILHAGGATTVRCTSCGQVHRTTIESTPTINRRIIVSQDGESIDAQIELEPDTTVTVGDEFLVETDEAILTARVTSLELLNGGRTEAAAVDNIRTLWSRAVGNVSLNVTLHPKDGRHDDTRSVKVYVPGDKGFEVGETYAIGEEEFSVERVLVRDDAVDHDRDAYDEAGYRIQAKDIKRLYGRSERGTPREYRGW